MAQLEFDAERPQSKTAKARRRGADRLRGITELLLLSFGTGKTTCYERIKRWETGRSQGRVGIRCEVRSGEVAAVARCFGLPWKIRLRQPSSARAEQHGRTQSGVRAPLLKLPKPADGAPCSRWLRNARWRGCSSGSSRGPGRLRSGRVAPTLRARPEAERQRCMPPS